MITRQSPGHSLAVHPGHAPAVMWPATGLPLLRQVPVSATLAANEAVAARRAREQPVLPLAFGEAGLPVCPVLRRTLAAATAANGYGPVAGHPTLRSAAAGYRTRRGLPTSPDQVVCGPGSKPLLFGLLLAIDADVALPRPSWVSYAAQAALTGTRAHFVPAPPTGPRTGRVPRAFAHRGPFGPRRPAPAPESARTGGQLPAGIPHHRRTT